MVETTFKETYFNYTFNFWKFMLMENNWNSKIKSAVIQWKVSLTREGLGFNYWLFKSAMPTLPYISLIKFIFLNIMLALLFISLI